LGINNKSMSQFFLVPTFHVGMQRERTTFQEAYLLVPTFHVGMQPELRVPGSIFVKKDMLRKEPRPACCHQTNGVVLAGDLAIDAEGFELYASPQRRWNNCGPVIHGVGSVSPGQDTS
jgi:hypothetical protein